MTDHVKADDLSHASRGPSGWSGRTAERLNLKRTTERPREVKTDLRVAVVHGRDWTRDQVRKRAEVQLAVQQVLASYGFGDRIGKLEVRVIEYSTVLDEALTAKSRPRKQHRLPVQRPPQVDMVRFDTKCGCCPERAWYEKVQVPFIRILTSPDWLTVLARGRFEDVKTYLGNGDARKEVMETVRAGMEGFSPQLIIGHSLGSVVVLDALAIAEAFQPTALITIGSPLSIPEFRRHLPVPARAWIASPQSAWLNVYDPTDVVTGGRPIGDLPPSRPAKAIVNLKVNHDRGNVTHSITHDMDAYLGHEPIARWLAYLADEPTATPHEAQAKLGSILNLNPAQTIVQL